MYGFAVVLAMTCVHVTLSVDRSTLYPVIALPPLEGTVYAKLTDDTPGVGVMLETVPGTVANTFDTVVDQLLFEVGAVVFSARIRK